MNDLQKKLREQLEQFFITVTEATAKRGSIDGWEGKKFAERLVEKAALRYVNKGGSA